ncbi:hypothetical protein NC653_028606 [Populus alba x Populus x berolinensis]|uniref:Uncharacterized protein n=1 Tax=Populus alba x Populus x berolinensis TaxID=444605 RepID=A0AAD6M0H0_9ROSI|nr:hypothetical protein NC653_028606 [Populus alba x Populus x berolinensis]
MEEMKEIEKVGGEGMEEVRDEPEDIKRIAPWTKQITVRGIVTAPFTRQENTKVQTCARVLFIF